MSGDFERFAIFLRGFRISWLTVGIKKLFVFWGFWGTLVAFYLRKATPAVYFLHTCGNYKPLIFADFRDFPCASIAQSPDSIRASNPIVKKKCASSVFLSV